MPSNSTCASPTVSSKGRAETIDTALSDGERNLDLVDTAVVSSDVKPHLKQKSSGSNMAAELLSQNDDNENCSPKLSSTTMQAKAAKRRVLCAEVPVHCRRRYAGQSKVSGTIKGSVKAGVKILYTIGREAVRR